MHEIQIAQRVLDEAEKQGVKTKIVAEVGELGHITAVELEESLRGLCKYEIVVNEKESKVKCNCGYEGKANIMDKGHGYCVFNCPKCNGKVEVLEGDEIKLIGVE